MTTLRRRDFVGLSIALAMEAAAPAARAGASGFSADDVVAAARELAKKPYKAPKGALPEPFGSLDYAQFAEIRRLPETALWASERLGFAVEPLHRGSIYSTPVELHVVDNGVDARIAYDRAAYDFGKLQIPKEIPDVGFSGIRILGAVEGRGFQDLAIFQGASFFRSLARGQNFGVTARGLSIGTGSAQGEEFPFFRELWIEKPTGASQSLVVHALLDSASVTGAYRFTLHPGETTIIDTEATLFARTALARIGAAAMTAAYFIGPLDERRGDDVRPNVFDVGGLQISSGKDEWLWRPFSNRETLQISVFADQNPRGFGMLQRQRRFEAFSDDEAHWEARPSLWIEPIGDWGEGELQLLEIPSERESNDNVIALWATKGGLEAGGSKKFAYRQFWCWAPPARPQTASVVSSRSGKFGRFRRFIIEFTGDAFADPAALEKIVADVQCSPGQIAASHTYGSKDRKSVRVVFDLDPPKEGYSELRVVLVEGGAPASETWLYRWTV